jgi:L-2-hydroxycarboxylate dehydrogenase (NAD+)
VQAIDISAFCDPADFRRRIDRMFEELKQIPVAPGFAEIMVPGEPEERKKAERMKAGCPIRAEDVALLSKLGEELGVAFPA